MPKKTILLYIIFLQALAAMLGSLYYSTFGDPLVNILSGQLFPAKGGFPPCELCWYARILMYPIVILSAVALLKEDEKVVDYILPLSVLGVILEAYHYGLQKLKFPDVSGCHVGVPCKGYEVQYLGFVTIPLLCLAAFTLITVLCVWIKRLPRAQKLDKNILLEKTAKTQKRVIKVKKKSKQQMSGKVLQNKRM